MPRKGNRETIEPGIARDGSGYSVRASVGSGPARRLREKRFPLTVDLPYLRAERAQLEADLRDELRQQAPERVTATRGTFAGDVQTYLWRMESTLDPDTHASRASELARWVEVFGTRPRHTLRSADAARAIAAWQTPQQRPPIVRKGKTYKPRPWVAPSPKTIQNRVRSLRHLYRILDGKRARTPVDDLEIKRAPKVRPRPVTVDTIRQTIAGLLKQEKAGRLRDAKTRARFMVLVSCGQRPAQIMRTTITDVDYQQRIWWVPPAKGGEAVPLPLNADAMIAWSLFLAADAWGDYDTRSFARTLRTAGWPAGVRPYTARHSVGIALSESGEDLGDVQAWMGHSRIQTTRDFYVPMLFSRLKAMSERTDTRLGMEGEWARYVGTPPEQRKSRRKKPTRAGVS